MKKIEGGYYIKARQIKNSDVAHAPPHVREIWDYLLREANHTGKKKHGQVLERGQVLTTYDEIRDDLHWMVGWRKERYTKHQCEIAMKFLRKPRRNGSMATTRKTTRGIVITILNYDFYQNPKNYESRNESHNESHNENGDSPQTTDTIDKNGKKEKNGISNTQSPENPGSVAAPTWKTDFDIYLDHCRESYANLLRDPNWICEQERLNPGVHIQLTMEKAAKNFWATPAGWNHKKKKRSASINWKLTWQNAITQKMNRVYKDAVGRSNGTIEPKTYSQCQDLERRQYIKYAFGKEGEPGGRQEIDKTASDIDKPSD